MGPDSVRTLDIWRDGMALVRGVYVMTRTWPKNEVFGLTAQLRRAAVSVPTNIAEGGGRGSAAETARFARIAMGSVYELDTLVQIAAELGYVTDEAAKETAHELTSLARRIAAYASYKTANA